MQTISKTVNKNLTNERSYFEFRLKHERSLTEFKERQNECKKTFDAELKKLVGVSPLRVRNAITLIKKITYKNAEERAVDAFEMIMNGMERSFARHYENSKSQIIDYLTNIFKLQDESKDYRNKKKKEFDVFKKELRNNGYDVSILNMAYIEFKNTLNYIKTQDITIDEYNERVKKYEYLNDLVSEFVNNEYDVLFNKKQIIEKQKQEKLDKENLYKEAVKSLFGITSKHEEKKRAEEDLINSVLMSMFDRGDLCVN